MLQSHLWDCGGGGIFTFECLRHFILTHFDLSYQASQSGMQQPTIHTCVARHFCRLCACHTLADLAPLAVSMRAPFSSSQHCTIMSIVIYFPPNMSKWCFTSFLLPHMYSFLSHASRAFLLLKGVVCTWIKLSCLQFPFSCAPASTRHPSVYPFLEAQVKSLVALGVFPRHFSHTLASCPALLIVHIRLYLILYWSLVDSNFEIAALW
jgi:hypothetical protein